MRLADFILKNTEPILAEWEAFARGIWPGGAMTDPATLRDDAEDMLRAAAAADMQSGQTAAQQADKSKGNGASASHSGRIDRASDVHGVGRHGSGFDLAAIIAEYRALRASVIRLWRESTPEPDANDLDDLTRFSESIDQSLAEAVLAFTKRVEREQMAASDEQASLVRQMRDMNEALLISSIRQQELTEQAHPVEMASARLAAIVASSEDAIISKDLSGVITSWNRGAQHLFGYTAEEALGQPVTLLIPDDHLDEEPQIIERVRRGESVEHYETVRRHKDGSLLDISLTISPIRDAAGRIVGASKIARDITERKAAEQALRRSEERFRTLFELGPVAVYSCDAAGVIREFNRRAAELWGRAPALGDTDERFCGSFKMIRPDGTVLAHEQCPMAEVLAGTIPHARDAEVHIERPDGSQVAVIVNIRPLTNEQGEITGAINCFYDITERKKAEQALRDSEERFRALADHMSQFAWTADAKGWIYWYNQRWYDYTGTTLEEMQGWGWKQVHHPDHVDRVVERVQRSWDTGELWEDTFPLRGKDGQYRWFLSRARPIRDAAGCVVRWFGTNTDVTALRELEKQNSQQAQALADLNRRKDEFLAMLSHELRNPLAPIMNAVQLLKVQREGTQIQRDAHGMIERQVSQLARLVDDLLEVSRISTGRIHLQEERIDLRGVVDRAIEATRPQCGQKSQSVAAALPPQPVWVFGDSVRLEQVVVNLLNNACKYTDRGGHLWVGLEQQAGEAVLRVRDNGIGIAPEILPRIFDLFTQADKSLDRSQGGLGIGLALVQSLVTMHHGRVEAKSTPGQGSEFVVRLPMVLSTPAPSAPAAKTAESPSRSLKVLVVDDNVDAAKGLYMLLKTYGHETRVAHEGAAAMQAALEYIPHVVLLDIGLPVINGFQVAQWIREQPALQNIVLIALTGYGQESDRERSQQAGFDHHLVKPVDFAKVQAILSAVAEQTR